MKTPITRTKEQTIIEIKNILPAKFRCVATLNEDWVNASEEIKEEHCKYLAVCLEVGEYGFGDTLEEAREDLEECIEIIITSAIALKDSTLISKADKKWFDIWDGGKKLSLNSRALEYQLAIPSESQDNSNQEEPSSLFNERPFTWEQNIDHSDLQAA